MKVKQVIPEWWCLEDRMRSPLLPNAKPDFAIRKSYLL